MSEPPVPVKRPPNAWIIFRAETIKRLPPVGPGDPRQSQGELSTMVAAMWAALPPSERVVYEHKADRAKIAHRIKYPDYKYEPKKKVDKERAKIQAKSKKEQEKQEKKDHRVGSSGPAAMSCPPHTHHHHLLLPSAPYFIPTIDFSNGGPSPPVSAASSRRSSPSPQLTSAVLALEASGSSFSFTGFPTTVRIASSSQLPFPILPIAQAAETTTIESPSADVVDEPQETQTLQLDNQVVQWDFCRNQPVVNSFESSANESNIPSGSAWNDTSLPEAAAATHEASQLTFSISETSAAQLDLWLQSNGISIIPDQTDANEFSFPVDFDMQSYAADLSGEFQVAVGPLHGLYEAPNYVAEPYNNDIDPYGAGIHDDSNLISEFLVDYPPMSDASYIEASNSFFASFAETYLEAGIAPYDSQSAPSNPIPSNVSFGSVTNYALQPVENSIQSSSSQAQPYIPPTGAGNSNRRVAATYRKDPFAVDQTAAAKQEIHAR